MTKRQEFKLFSCNKEPLERGAFCWVKYLSKLILPDAGRLLRVLLELQSLSWIVVGCELAGAFRFSVSLIPTR